MSRRRQAVTAAENQDMTPRLPEPADSTAAASYDMMLPSFLPPSPSSHAPSVVKESTIKTTLLPGLVDYDDDDGDDEDEEEDNEYEKCISNSNNSNANNKTAINHAAVLNGHSVFNNNSSSSSSSGDIIANSYIEPGLVRHVNVMGNHHQSLLSHPHHTTTSAAAIVTQNHDIKTNKKLATVKLDSTFKSLMPSSLRKK